MKKCRECGYFINREKVLTDDDNILFGGTNELSANLGILIDEEVTYIHCFGKVFNNQSLLNEYIVNSLCLRLYPDKSGYIKWAIQKQRVMKSTLTDGDNSSIIRISKDEYIKKLKKVLESFIPDSLIYSSVKLLLEDETL